MKIHEYQAKEVLRGFGVVTPRGIACFNVDEAVAAANTASEPVDPNTADSLKDFAVNKSETLFLNTSLHLPIINIFL